VFEGLTAGGLHRRIIVAAHGNSDRRASPLRAAQREV
jgi:hypothetical protein